MVMFGVQTAVSDAGMPKIFLEKALSVEVALFTDTGGWPLDAKFRYFPTANPGAAIEVTVGDGRPVGSYHLVKLSGINRDVAYSAELQYSSVRVSLFDSAPLSLLADPKGENKPPIQSTDPIASYTP